MTTSVGPHTPPASLQLLAPEVDPAGAARQRRRWRLPPSWPLYSAFALYPLWKVLGGALFVFILMAVPMALRLSRRRPILLPPGFALWVLLLVFVAASTVMLGETAPGTLPPDGGLGRYIGVGLRASQYVALTVMLLYIGNLTEREMSQRQMARMLSVLFLATVLGGVIGALFPAISFASPLQYLLPQSLLEYDFVERVTHVSVAQIQDVLGEGPHARPAAPYEYTNTWGQNYSLLLGWFAVAWLHGAGGARRAVAILLLAVSAYPLLVSLNRGVWAGLGVALAVVMLRWAIARRTAALVAAVCAVAAGALLIVVSPAGALIAERLESGHSDEGRAALNAAAVDAAVSSPVLGYGAGRALIGSENSIAIGATPDCPQCGNLDVGSDGQFWLLLISHGFPGVFLYAGFFLVLAWRFRRDVTPIGTAGLLCCLLPLCYMFLYPALTTPLAIAFAGIGILWRNDRLSSGRASVAESAPAPVTGARAGVLDVG